MTDLPARPATYADIEALPEHVVGEILYGRLITRPRPVTHHGGAAMGLAVQLAGPFQYDPAGPSGWIFLGEPELHIGAHVTVPEIAAWRRERFVRYPNKSAITVVPDWVCEVLSPSTERYDRGEKAEIYADAGIKHYWIADPRTKMLEVYELHERGWLRVKVFKDNDTVVAPPFEQASFALGLLWPFDSEPDASAGQQFHEPETAPLR